MRTEKGIVRSIEEGWAWVEVEAQLSCNHCGSYLHTHEGPRNGRGERVRAENQARAGIGDTVVLGFHEPFMLMGALSLFILPLIPISLGIAVGSWIADLYHLGKQPAMISGALAGIALAFVFIRIVARRLNKNPRVYPTVIRVMRPGATPHPPNSHGGRIGCPMCGG